VSGPAVEDYLKSLIEEINLYGAALGDEEKNISSLFFGGGTPTCLPAGALKMVLDELRYSFSLMKGCEITVEANPGTVDAAGLGTLLKAGVNRLSIGGSSLSMTPCWVCWAASIRQNRQLKRCSWPEKRALPT
jgi:oxygen-independent coproporphyrinogen-3 oxidase